MNRMKGRLGRIGGGGGREGGGKGRKMGAEKMMGAFSLFFHSFWLLTLRHRGGCFVAQVFQSVDRRSVVFASEWMLLKPQNVHENRLEAPCVYQKVRSLEQFFFLASCQYPSGKSCPRLHSRFHCPSFPD